MSNIAQTLNVYYTASQFNPVASQPGPALVDEKLIFPLLKDASQFQVGLVKAKIPLDTIPLTQSNIPFKTWQIELRKGSSSGFAYVEQLGSKNANYIWGSNGGIISQYQYSSSGILSFYRSVDLSSFIPFIYMFVVDDFENLYCIGSELLNGSNTLFYIFSNTANPSVYYSDTSFQDLQCISIDPSQKIYLATLNAGVQIYSNINSFTGVSITLIKTITDDFNNTPLQNIVTVCSDQTTIIGYDSNKIQVYDALLNPISSPITLSEIINMANQSAILHDQNTFVLSDIGTSGDGLIGLQISSDVAVNCDNAVPQFAGGTWNTVPHINLAGNGALGVGSAPNTLFYLVPNPNGTPIAVNSAYNGDYTCANTAGTWFASNYTNLMTYNTNNTMSVFDVNFTAGGSAGPITSFDIDKITGKFIGIGSLDSNMYQSNLAIYPNQIWAGPTGGAQGSVQTTFVNQGVINETPVFQTSAFVGSGNPMLGFFDLTTSYLSVQSTYVSGGSGNPVTGALDLYLLDRSMVQTATASYTSSDLGGGCAVVCNCISPYNIMIVANGLGDFYFFDTTTLAPINTATITAIPVTTGLFFTIVGAGDGFCLSDGINFYYYTYDSLTQTCTLVTSNTWTSLGFDIITDMYIDYGYPRDLIVMGQKTSDTGQNLYYLAFSPNFAGIVSTSGPFKSTGDSYIPELKFPLSFGFTSEDGISYIQGDQIGHKLAVPSNTLASGFDFFWIDGVNKALEFLPSSVSLNYQQLVPLTTPNSCIPLCFQLSTGSPVGFYTYDTPITFSPPLGIIQLNSVAMSNNSNIIYFTDTNGLVYQGKLIGTVVQNYAQITVDGTYASISTFKNTTFDSSIIDYTISNQTLVQKQSLGLTPILGLTRNLISEEYLVCTGDSSSNLISYPANTLNPSNWTSTIIPGGCIFAKNGENIDAGPTAIYTYQTLIDAINTAFLVAFGRANVNGAGLLTSPSISMNFQTGLVTINYSNEYVNSVNGSLTTTNGILFNTSLSNLIQFYTSPDTIQPGFDLLYLTADGPNSPYQTIQTSPTITAFNMLDKILLSSTTIFVANSYFGNNQVNNVITDIDIDTTQIVQNIGQWLLYQPNFLRPFALASNNAIDRIQLSVGYSYIDGTSFPLILNPGSGWNAKLDFVRKYNF